MIDHVYQSLLSVLRGHLRELMWVVFDEGSGLGNEHLKDFQLILSVRSAWKTLWKTLFFETIFDSQSKIWLYMLWGSLASRAES